VRASSIVQLRLLAYGTRALNLDIPHACHRRPDAIYTSMVDGLPYGGCDCHVSDGISLEHAAAPNFAPSAE